MLHGGSVRALFALMVGLGVLVGLPSAAHAAGGERIVSFAADYTVRTDGSMDVTETLVWQFDDDTSHGIQRDIRTSAGYDQKPDTYRRYDLSDVSASSPSGAPADVAVSETGAETRIRIGNPDETVQGRQTYVVRYHLAHVVNGFEDHSELYWNVTGQRVEIPTDTVRVTVRGPAAVARTACFYGAQGSTDTCTSSPGNRATFAAKDLAPNQQVSILASFPLGRSRMSRPTSARGRPATPGTPASPPPCRRPPRGR